MFMTGLAVCTIIIQITASDFSDLLKLFEVQSMEIVTQKVSQDMNTEQMTVFSCTSTILHEYLI